jgi:hypothetical protein
VAQSVELQRFEHDDRGFIPSRSKEWTFFLFATASRAVLGPTQSPIQLVPHSLSPGIKRPGRELHHPTQSMAKHKNAWSYTSAPPIRLHGMVFS